MNHKIKMLGDWKVSKIPDLIDRIRVSTFEIRGALHGRENLELSDRAKHLRVMHDLWVDLTDEQRHKVLRFRPSVGTLESADGQF